MDYTLKQSTPSSWGRVARVNSPLNCICIDNPTINSPIRLQIFIAWANVTFVLWIFYNKCALNRIVYCYYWNVLCGTGIEVTINARLVHVSLRFGQLSTDWIVWCAINRIIFYTSQHMTTLATRNTCVLSRTWELERMAWQRTQTALPGTQNELPYLVKCINNYFFVSQIFYAFFCVTKYTPIFLYSPLPFIFLKTDTYPTCSSLSPFRHPHTHHIFPPKCMHCISPYFFSLYTHTLLQCLPVQWIQRRLRYAVLRKPLHCCHNGCV